MRHLVEEAEAVLRPDNLLDLTSMARSFTLRTSDGFVETFGPGLVARMRADAPHVRLNFLQKPDKDSTPLRDGRVDLETGVVEESSGPELRTQALFRDRLVGVVREGHPVNRKRASPSWYAGAEHVVVSRSGVESEAIDLPFLPADMQRRVGAVVSGFSAAIALARGSDLVATVPERHTEGLRRGMVGVSLPMPPIEFTVSMMWHPRMEGDPAHRWLRSCVREICQQSALPGG